MCFCIFTRNYFLQHMRLFKHPKRPESCCSFPIMSFLLIIGDDIVSKRHDEYQYSPLEAAPSKFLPLLGEFFFPYYGSFFPTSALVKKQQRPARFGCFKTHGFRAGVEQNIICTSGWGHFLSRAVFRTRLRSRFANIALDTKRLLLSLGA